MIANFYWEDIILPHKKRADVKNKAIDIMQKSFWNPPAVKPSYGKVSADKEKKWFKPSDSWEQNEEVIREPVNVEQYKPLSIDQ